MFLSEIHEPLPPKLFSKFFGETINELLDAINELGPEAAIDGEYEAEVEL